MSFPPLVPLLCRLLLLALVLLPLTFLAESTPRLLGLSESAAPWALVPARTGALYLSVYLVNLLARRGQPRWLHKAPPQA